MFVYIEHVDELLAVMVLQTFLCQTRSILQYICTALYLIIPGTASTFLRLPDEDHSDSCCGNVAKLKANVPQIVSCGALR